MPALLIAGLLGGIYFFMPSEYDKLMHKALIVKNENPKETVFDGFPEPPMPNQKENEKTILGIDSDKNGIRDDIDIWINRTGKNYNERMALRQMAIAMQSKLKSCNDNDYKNHTLTCQEVANSEMCIVFATKLNRSETYNNLEILFENTNKRKDCRDFYSKANCSSNLDSNRKQLNCNFEVK